MRTLRKCIPPGAARRSAQTGPHLNAGWLAGGLTGGLGVGLTCALAGALAGGLAGGLTFLPTSTHAATAQQTDTHAAAAPPVGTPDAAPRLRVQTVAHGLVNPWSLAFLPDGRLLVTERPGRMRIVGADGRLGAPLAGLPPVLAEGQGGLLDVALSPRFAQDRLVYWTFVEAADADGDSSGTALARGRLEGSVGAERLADVQVIFRQRPKVSGALHFGGRLAWAPDGRLFLTLGERYHHKDRAQTLDNHLGKVLRLEADGRAAADNPLVQRAGALPEIWSWGHRNVQAAAIQPDSGALWITEHGPQGGDELNRVQRGGNHGWPVITHGRNYVTGTRIGEGGSRADVTPPVTWWGPTSIAPSGMAWLTSNRYPGWQGQLFIGALRGQQLLRLKLDSAQRVVEQQPLLQNLNERIRDVRQGPDGWLYLLTDNTDGRVLRLLTEP